MACFLHLKHALKITKKNSDTFSAQVENINALNMNLSLLLRLEKNLENTYLIKRGEKVGRDVRRNVGCFEHFFFLFLCVSSKSTFMSRGRGRRAATAQSFCQKIAEEEEEPRTKGRTEKEKNRNIEQDKGGNRSK